MTEVDKRRLDTALWHARESILVATTQDDEQADFHLEAAREFLGLVNPSAAKMVRTAEDVVLKCTELSDVEGLILA